MKTQHRVLWHCSRCKKTYETIEHIRPKPELYCGYCLMKDVETVIETVKMEILTTNPLSPQPTTILVGHDREPID